MKLEYQNQIRHVCITDYASVFELKQLATSLFGIAENQLENFKIYLTDAFGEPQKALKNE